MVAEDQERVRNAIRLEVLKHNVPDQGLYKISYLRIVDNKYAYYEMNTIKIKDNSGKVYFVIGMRDVDEKVRMQMKKDREMEMQREIITALGYDYFSVLLVDPEKDHVTIFRQRSLNGKSIADLCAKYHNCWSEFISNYAKERVSDASYDEFMEKLSLDYIRSAKESYISVYEYVSDDGIVCVNMIEKADADHYDHVLMDIQMPNMDGYKATQLIRQLPDRKKSRLPVIAMTANAFEEDKRNALAAGMDGFLSKPIVIKELIHTLQNTMDMK